MSEPPAPATDDLVAPITVLLADDHPALRLGLRFLLEQASGIVVVGEVSDGREALAQIESLQPVVAVIDCQLPGLSGPEIAAEVQRRALRTQLVALSAYRDETFVRGMITAGAAGYLVKEEAPARIVAAIRAAARGDGWFSPSVAGWVGRYVRQAPGDQTNLTEREKAVLWLVARGKTNKEIAQQLDVAERTVEFHMSNILRKLDVASRVEAAMWARDHIVL
jgi:DNA-binding NarL/FixJ family response regulator